MRLKMFSWIERIISVWIYHCHSFRQRSIFTRMMVVSDNQIKIFLFCICTSFKCNNSTVHTHKKSCTRSQSLINRMHLNIVSIFHSVRNFVFYICSHFFKSSDNNCSGSNAIHVIVAPYKDLLTCIDSFANSFDSNFSIRKSHWIMKFINFKI